MENSGERVGECGCVIVPDPFSLNSLWKFSLDSLSHSHAQIHVVHNSHLKLGPSNYLKKKISPFSILLIENKVGWHYLGELYKDSKKCEINKRQKELSLQHYVDELWVIDPTRANVSHKQTELVPFHNRV